MPENGLLVLLGEVPPLFHYRIAFRVSCIAVAVEGGGSGVDEMNHSAFGNAGEFLACHSLYGLRTPICTYIAENHCLVGQKMAEKHGESVQ